MTRRMCISVGLTVLSAAIPLRAANRPHAGTDTQNPTVWTNIGVENLRNRDLISIVGRSDEEGRTSASAPTPYVSTDDPEWYAEQAAKLRDALEHRRAQLREYRQALEDARNLRDTTGGVNLDEGDAGITPEAGIEILEQRVNEAQTELDSLEELARHHGIPPGTLRG
jgi:hypothetical protein